MRVIFEVGSATRATDRFEETQLTAVGRFRTHRNKSSRFLLSNQPGDVPVPVWAFQPRRNRAPIALRDDGTLTNGSAAPPSWRRTPRRLESPSRAVGRASLWWRTRLPRGQPTEC